MSVNSPRQVLFASLIGTTIEFFDFYIYATAAVIVFPKLFFPASDPASATLASLATFAIAFVARPIGSALFGHFGDRVGRKTTLVAALLTMGLSTVAIGGLPAYASIGRAAPLCLAICRFGQGLGHERAEVDVCARSRRVEARAEADLYLRRAIVGAPGACGATTTADRRSGRRTRALADR